MISVTELLVENPLTGNYFASDVYVKGLIDSGLIENRRGDRLLALPESLIRGLYVSLEQEIGPAAESVLIGCGDRWGKDFYRRFYSGVTEYYGAPLTDLSAAELLWLLQECWKTHGWGELNLDQPYQPEGVLIVETRHSPFISHAPKTNRPMGFLECGILRSFFSQLNGQPLHCVQTTCESLGADCNRFVLGLENCLKRVEAMVESGRSHSDIMQTLVNPS
ncbi:MAG: 4-vinyl reductase [Leptolyngbyaceae cyanobacterium MO_188.B28]|nr:4-vinyl reductase [Leptolyngbyaceae cyanobacterium MO_188.B28]